jgi:hypothetical protein
MTELTLRLARCDRPARNAPEGVVVVQDRGIVIDCMLELTLEILPEAVGQLLVALFPNGMWPPRADQAPGRILNLL